MENELILSSGGMKGCMIVGALEELDKRIPLHYFKYFTGTSVGGLISTMYVVGFTIEEMKDMFVSLDWFQFFDIKLINLIENMGFVDGTKIHQIFKACFLQKGFSPNTTFLELYQRTGKVLTLVTTNITKRKIEYHNYLTQPQMSVLLSLRMSINIPIVLEPILYQGDYYVDGAVLDHFPYYYHKNTRKYGVCLLEEDLFKITEQIEGDTNLMNLFISILMTLWKEQLKLKLKGKKTKNTVYIVDEEYASTGFDVDKETKSKMYGKGVQFGKEYFTKREKIKRRKYLEKKYFQLWRNKCI